MAKDLKPIQVLRAERNKGKYVGTDTEYKPYAVIKGQIVPVTDNYSIATYGERISRMYNVIAEYGADVVNGDKLVINGEECSVVSVLVYSSHVTITAERTGAMYGNGV